MSNRLADFTLSRAGWGNRQALDLDVTKIEAARDPATLPNLLRVEADEPLADMLSWPERSGCALQCLYSVTPAGGNGPDTVMTAEAVKWGGAGETLEIELVKGWCGEPFYWGNRWVEEEEVEAAIHGLAPNDELQLLSIPTERDTRGTPRARIMESPDDEAVLFIAQTTEEARILSGVVERLLDTGALAPRTGERYPFAGSSLAGAQYQRTRKQAPLVTRWLGGHGTRSQQALEQRSGAPPERWPGAAP